MPPSRTAIRPNQVNFFPRERIPRRQHLERKHSLAAFKARTSPSPPKPKEEEPKLHAILFPAWLRCCTGWIKERLGSTVPDEEEPMMSGASSGLEMRYWYDESAWRNGEMWEEVPAWDRVEGRMVELGLS